MNMVKVLPLRFQQYFGSLIMLLAKGPLNLHFWDIYLTTLFWVCKSKNTSAMRVIYFLKMLKTEPRFRKCKEISGNNFFVSEIIATEDVAVNCLYKWVNTCDRQLMSWQTLLKFCISLRETSPNWIVFTVSIKFDKGAVVQISTVFGLA